MSNPAFTSVLVASSDLGDDLAEAFGVLTVAAIVGGILGSRLEDVAGIPWLCAVPISGRWTRRALASTARFLAFLYVGAPTMPARFEHRSA
jgi:hypothetical protein